MLGVGSSELVVIGVFVLLLFGPTLLAFWLGFNMGRKSTPAPARNDELAEKAAPTESTHGEITPSDERNADE